MKADDATLSAIAWRRPTKSINFPLGCWGALPPGMLKEEAAGYLLGAVAAFCNGRRRRRAVERIWRPKAREDNGLAGLFGDAAKMPALVAPRKERRRIVRSVPNVPSGAAKALTAWWFERGRGRRACFPRLCLCLQTLR